MRIRRSSTSSRTGRGRIAPIGISLVSGFALVSGFTVATALGAAAPAGASVPLQPKAPPVVKQPGQPLVQGKSTHVNQAGPVISSTPHLVPHTSVNQTFTVNTTNDTDVSPSNSTTCQDSDGNCSLRAAVEAANNDAPNVDQINVPAGYDIQLTEASEINVYNSMFISGVGSGAAPIIDGLGATEDFDVYGNGGPTPSVEMTNLTIQNGSATDGADIYLGDGFSDPADLTLSGVTVTGGTASNYGGGIYVDQDSALWTDSGTTISHDSSDICGGGISNNQGAVNVSGSTIGNGAAPCGGGVYNDGTLVLDAAQINDNYSFAGAAVYNDWSFSDTGSSYSGNTAGTSSEPLSNPEGAVLYNDDTAAMSDVTVSGSQAWSSSGSLEGGVFFNAWELSLNNVSVANTTNRADGNGIDGGIVANEADQINGTYNGTLAIDGLTVSGTSNGASGQDTAIYGGVIYNDYKASVSGLDVSATTNNSGGDGVYGGVGDVDWTVNCCPAPPNFDGSTEYQSVTVSGTNNTGDSVEGGVFEVFDDYIIGTALSGNITDGTITGTTDTATSTDYVLGGVLNTYSPQSLSDVSIDSTTVNAAGTSVYGGAVGSFNEGQYPSVTANDVSVTNTNISNVGGGNGYVEGGAWYSSADLVATGVQILDTTVTDDGLVLGGALSLDGLSAEGTRSSLTDSTIARTTTSVPPGGGIGVFLVEPAVLTNVTIDDNTTTGSSSEGADGVVVGAPVSFTNDTIANNTVGGGGDVAGIYAQALGRFKNTIVQTNGGPNCEGGEFVSDGGNLEAGGNTCSFTAPSDQVSVGNAMVAPVANNGGPVETAALQPGSPAIGQGLSAGCPTTDARGVARPSGNCDVGAFQLSTQGYWMVAADGGIFNFANAGFYGSMGGTQLNSPIVGMAPTADGMGYWEVASDGGIFAFGDAVYYGSMGSQHLNKPIVGMAATPDGGGYWEVASDGGIFAFGDASFFGSAGSIPLNKPVVGMSAAPNGQGYWLVASDGGIFTYGSGAGFFGSAGSLHLNKPVVGMAATPSGGGYWLFASDGGLFNYGDATFQGSMGGIPLAQPVVGGAAKSID
ncbi:MAG TPA: CSLREA domain-containing protein [Acidimicrobiales bacterium]|nr:CSLREA domain-containing protein [Acidimicrobiales bacterium]